jgi:hypothetical protein
VLANGGQLESILLASNLTIDIGWFGSPEPKRAFLHSSGLHGVEGFAGSAIQLQWLNDGIAGCSSEDAVIIVHILNPFGMANLRRVDEENVDLNHNFLPAGETYTGAPPEYAALNELLNPASSSGGIFWLRAFWRAAALQRVLDQGQYDLPRGLSYGGGRHSAATRRFHLYISGKLARAERVVAIDVHTGPGNFGQDVLIVNDSEENLARVEEMQSAYGSAVQPNESEMPARGSLEALCFRMFPGAQVYFATQEFGCCSQMAALATLRNENRNYHFGDTTEKAAAGKKLLETFCPPDEDWRNRVLARGREVIQQGLALSRR